MKYLEIPGLKIVSNTSKCQHASLIGKLKCDAKY